MDRNEKKQRLPLAALTAGGLAGLANGFFGGEGA